MSPSFKTTLKEIGGKFGGVCFLNCVAISETGLPEETQIQVFLKVPNVALLYWNGVTSVLPRFQSHII